MVGLVAPIFVSRVALNFSSCARDASTDRPRPNSHAQTSLPNARYISVPFCTITVLATRTQRTTSCIATAPYPGTLTSELKISCSPSAIPSSIFSQCWPEADYAFMLTKLACSISYLFLGHSVGRLVRDFLKRFRVGQDTNMEPRTLSEIDPTESLVGREHALDESG